jgi:hypothetical protein
MRRGVNLNINKKYKKNITFKKLKEKKTKVNRLLGLYLAFVY